MASSIVGVSGILVMIFAVALLISERVRTKIANWFNAGCCRIWLVPLCILLYYSALTILLGEWNLGVFASLMLYFLIPFAVMCCTGPISRPARWIDLIIVLMFWLPIEFNWVPAKWYSFEIAGRRVAYPMTEFGAVIALFLLFTAWRQLDMRCSWRLSFKDIAALGRALIAIIAVILPVAWAIGFVKFNIPPEVIKYWWGVPILFVSYFFTIGIPEELVTRGILQNFFTKTLGATTGIAIASLIFGIAHLNNPVLDFDVPNWPYFGFATVAGAMYGYVYWKRQSLIAAALLHTAVDVIWFLFFSG